MIMMYSGVYGGSGNSIDPTAPPPSYEDVMRTSKERYSHTTEGIISRLFGVVKGKI